LYPQADTSEPRRSAAKTARTRDVDPGMRASCSSLPRKVARIGSIRRVG
jgi:hypothetical protein